MDYSKMSYEEYLTTIKTPESLADVMNEITTLHLNSHNKLKSIHELLGNLPLGSYEKINAFVDDGIRLYRSKAMLAHKLVTSGDFTAAYETEKIAFSVIESVETRIKACI